MICETNTNMFCGGKWTANSSFLSILASDTPSNAAELRIHLSDKLKLSRLSNPDLVYKTPSSPFVQLPQNTCNLTASSANGVCLDFFCKHSWEEFSWKEAFFVASYYSCARGYKYLFILTSLSFYSWHWPVQLYNNFPAGLFRKLTLNKTIQYMVKPLFSSILQGNCTIEGKIVLTSIFIWN